MRALLTSVLGSVLLTTACAAEPAEDEGQAETSSRQTTSSEDRVGFMCQCKASGPGFEQGADIDKMCSYECDCDALTATGRTKVPAPVKLKDTVSTAKSKEKWDFGSHICHGQYAWRPTLDSKNWEIKVKFSSFQITQFGFVSYPDESVETAIGVRESLRRTEEAPEIRDAIAKELGVKLAK